MKYFLECVPKAPFGLYEVEKIYFGGAHFKQVKYLISELTCVMFSCLQMF